MMILKQRSLLSALKIQALVRLTSVSKVKYAKKIRKPSDRELVRKYENKMHLAVKTYRHLPLIVRSQIENWKIEPEEVALGRLMSKSITMSAKTYQATYKWVDVACKVKECDLLVETSDLRRMHKELTVLAQLRHPNVVGFLGASFESRSCMLVTELLTGGSLQDVLARPSDSKARRRPSLPEAMRWALALVRAVTYMHQSDPPVMHRDLRPANLLLSGAGALEVTGFGSALILSPPPPPPPSLAADPQTSRDLSGTAQLLRQLLARWPSPCRIRSNKCPH